MTSKLPARAFAAALVAASSALLAQAVTVPSALAGVEGGGASNIPFGSNQSCRYQCIYDAEELPWTGPRVLTALLLRADNNQPFAAIAAKGFLQISVLMSTTSRTSADASAVFEENRGIDATWVMTNQMIQLPAQPLLPTAPRPANIPFVFTVPWAYGLTPATPSMPPPRNLLVEIHVHSQPSGAYRLDNLSGCISPTSTFGQAGPACAVPATTPVNLELSGGASMLAGSNYTWNVTAAPPSMPFLVTLNVTNAGGLLGNPAWPLPYPMFDPANPSQPSPALMLLGWPAPDCWINVDPIVAIGGLADAAGNGTASAPVPPGRQVVGQPFFAQAIAMAPTANPLRMITSLGRSTTVCGPLGVTRIHAFYDGTATPPVVPTSGQVLPGAGLVFDVQ